MDQINIQAVRFREFGEIHIRDMSPHYAYLATRIADERELLAVASAAAEGQPTPNLLFAAVRFLLDRGASLDLLGTYPTEFGSEIPPRSFELFRKFVLANRIEIERLVSTRRVQSNVVRRCAVLLLGLMKVSELFARLSFTNIEIGASAGLTLLWDRFSYEYGSHSTVRNTKSSVVVETEIRGRVPLRAGQSLPEVTSNLGIELDPISDTDEFAMAWLRALIFPEHSDNRVLFDAAVEVARLHPPNVIAGDALNMLPALLSDLPGGHPVNIYHSHTLNQFPVESRDRLDEILREASRKRPVTRLAFEATPAGYSDLRLVSYENGNQVDAVVLANCEAHGRWIEWRVEPLGG